MYTFAKMCLLCLNNNNKCSLINCNDCDLNNISAFDKLKQIIPELISETIYKVPTWICPTCKEELDSSYIFYQKCKKSLSLLQSYNEKLKSVNVISSKESYDLKINIPKINPVLNENNYESITIKDEIHEDTFLFDQLIGRKSPNNTSFKQEIEIFKALQDTFEQVESASKNAEDPIKNEINKDSSNTVKEENSETIKEENSETIKEELSLFDEDTLICNDEKSSASNVSAIKNEINPEVFDQNEEKSYFGMFRNKSALESAFPTTPKTSALPCENITENTNTNNTNDKTKSDNQVVLQEIINKTISDALNNDESNRNKRRTKRPICYNFSEESEEEFKDSDFEPDLNSDLDELLSDDCISDSSSAQSLKKRKTNDTSEIEKTSDVLFSYFQNRINSIFQNNIVQNINHNTINESVENVRNNTKTPEPAVVIHHLPQREKEVNNLDEAPLNFVSSIQTKLNSIFSKDSRINQTKDILTQTIISNNAEKTSAIEANLNSDKPIKSSFRRKYVCNICRNKFKSSDELKQHTQSHEIKEYKCKKCFKLCLNEADLESHMNEHNTPKHTETYEIKEYKCNKCFKLCLNDQDLESHMNEHNTPKHTETYQVIEYKCNKCFKLCLNESDLESHMNEHNKPKPPEYSAQHNIIPYVPKSPLIIKFKQLKPVTSITTTDENVLYYPPVYPEVVEVKSGDSSSESDYYMEKFFCSLCNKKFENFPEHMKIHQEENKALCVYCKETFPIKNQLFQHLRDVHCTNEPICQICNESFTNIELLFLHMYSHYGTEVHKCPKCEQLFLNATLLYRHLEDVHKYTEFSCIKCDEKAESLKVICQHYHLHESKSSTLCHICGKRVRTRRQMRLHIRNYHSGPGKAYSCPECGKPCSSRAGMRTHMESKHMNQSHACEICSKIFKTRVALRLHLTSHAEQKKRFECKECGKKFRLKFLLKNHERVHTGEKPFECKTCGKKFTQEASLLVHNRIHTGEKPFTCEQCGKSYTQSYVYKMHLKKHHSNNNNSNSKENKSDALSEEKET